MGITADAHHLLAPACTAMQLKLPDVAPGHPPNDRSVKKSDPAVEIENTQIFSKQANGIHETGMYRCP